MSPPEPLRKIERPLRDWEIVEARRVFGNTLNYPVVRVHEGAAWPDTANQLVLRLKRIPPPPTYTPNAITLGNHCYFPVNFPKIQAEWDQYRYSFGWLIHELTHTWQFQYEGWGYLYRALAAQFNLGAQAYDFGDAAGLLAAIAAGKNFSSFNPEQQGAIAQTYYDYQRVNRDVAAWTPFVTEIQMRV